MDIPRRSFTQANRGLCTEVLLFLWHGCNMFILGFAICQPWQGMMKDLMIGTHGLSYL